MLNSLRVTHYPVFQEVSEQLHTTAEHMRDLRALCHPPQPLFLLTMTIYITTHHVFSDSFLTFITLNNYSY